MLDGVIKLRLGERIGEFEVIGYRAREKNFPGYPVYLVRHKCGSETTIYHRRQYAAKCEHCIYEALRQGFSQNPTNAARREYIQRLDEEYPSEPHQAAPALVQSPQPSKPLSQL